MISKIIEKFKKILGQASPNIFEERINKRLIEGTRKEKSKSRERNGNKNNKNK